MPACKELFGKAKDGQDLYLFTLSNRGTMKVKLTNLGATLVSILFQDKNEVMQDVILGYDTPEEYYANSGHFGEVVGRSGNRIDKARFTLNGKEYQLPVNNNENNLHSGPDYFGKRAWDVVEASENSVCFGLKDADLQQGYPGNFECTVTYTLTDEDQLRLHYQAKCDQDTVVNMTNHVYFNLGGHASGDVLDHEMILPAYYTPVRDYQAIPTGEIAPVAGTDMDFTTARKIGERIDNDFDQLTFVGGYDHNYAIAPDKGPVVKFAEAYCPATGICLEAFTDLPGVQFYTGNSMNTVRGKGGATYNKRGGFCLETQYYPNSVNQEGFASPILKAGETYDTTTTYKFSVR